LNASPARQLRACADPDAVAELSSFRQVMLQVLREQVETRPVLANWQAVLDYLRADMAYHINERFRVLHLNAKNVLIRDEVMSQGTIDRTAVHPREVIHRSLELGSASIILVHNHPSGDPSPSHTDIEVTRAIAEIAKRMGIALHDHIIIAAKGHVSFKSQGLI
jgi:DNA repair protein RadC